MLEQSRLTLATALAIAALGASPALAAPIDPVASGTGEAVASQDRGALDARGENAASGSDYAHGGTHYPVAPASSAGDQRTPDAVEPFVRPVPVETGEPASPGFDCTSSIIGAAAGLALAVLAGGAVGGGRLRHGRAGTA
jgi:hypothetical protein